MAHVFRYELGGPAVHSGLAMKALPTRERHLHGRAGARRRQPTGRPPHGADAGRLPREHPQRRRRQGLAARPRPRGRRGGAHGTSLRVHLDGARLLNAAVASGVVRCGVRAGVRHRHALPLEGPRLPARRADRRLRRADGEGAAAEAPVRRRDAPGRNRRRGRRLRARAQRRAPGRGPRERAAARRGARRRRPAGRPRAGRDELRPGRRRAARPRRGRGGRQRCAPRACCSRSAPARTSFGRSRTSTSPPRTIEQAIDGISAPSA